MSSKAKAKPPNNSASKTAIFTLKPLLDNFLTGTDTSRYELDYFLSILKQKQSDAVFIESILVQLRPVIPLLEPKHFEQNLISALFVDIKWHVHFSNNERVLKLLADFLIDLNSAYTHYIQRCLTMLIKMFQVVNATGTNSPTLPADTVQINCENVYKLAQGLIVLLVKQAPTCKANLIKQLEQLYPYMIKDSTVQEAYIRNLLQIAQVFGDLRQKILEICIQKLLKIDVNCRREQIVEYELAKCQTEQPNGTEENPEEIKLYLADRLDVMMHSLFAFINQTCLIGNEPSNTVNWEATKLLYKDLLYCFDKYILVTYGSSHVQFLLFYICGLRAQLAEGFVDYLWKKFNSIKSCSITKQICAYYLGSFMARAKYIPPGTYVSMLKLMVDWIHSYIEKNHHSSSCLLFDLHRTFFSLCQTLFYVVIFRNRFLFSESSDSAALVGGKPSRELVNAWRLNDIVHCKLNPLRYCLPSVRDRFARLAHVHGVAYCFKVIDANNRMALPVCGGGVQVQAFFKDNKSHSAPQAKVARREKIAAAEVEASGNPLDSFFPFDPYVLPRSRQFVERFYVAYSDVTDEQLEHDDEDEDEEDSETESEEESADDDEEYGNGVDLATVLKNKINKNSLFDCDDSDLENSIE